MSTSSDSLDHPVALNAHDPNKLIVEDRSIEDSSFAYINDATLETLGLFKGDTIICKGKQLKATILIVSTDENVEDGKIQINKVARNNLRVKLGDATTVHPSTDIKCGNRIAVLPFDDSVAGLTGNIFEIFLKPFFHEDAAYRPVHKGDTFIARGAGRAVEFKVVETDPEDYCIVAHHTVIHYEGEPLKRADEEANLNEDESVVREDSD